MRWFIVLVMVLTFGNVRAQAEAKRPNIVLILADDLGMGDLGCYHKDSKIPTPHIDTLARRGLRFSDAHSPSSVCSPTRYALLTGRYAWRGKLKRGVLQGYDPLLIEPGRMTLASLLKQLGYRTACIGKWHLGLGTAKKTDYAQPLKPGPNSVGFDYFFGIAASLDMPPYVFLENERPTQPPDQHIAASKSRREGGGGFWREGAIAKDFTHEGVLPALTKQAVAWLEQQARSKDPFFLYVPLTGPHTPWMPTREFLGKSKAGFYGDFVVQVDHTVGKIVETLERLKLAENTLIIFTSDNGAHWTLDDIRRYAHRANLVFRGQKADIWEAGHRIPFITVWPGKIKANTTSTETICLVDLLATMAGVTGAKLPKNAGEDSYDLTPVLLDRKRDGPMREATVHHSATGMFAIRQAEWVLIEGLGSGGFTKPQTEKPMAKGPKGQLYNLAADPQQERNLYLEQPGIVERLQMLLDRYRKQERSVR